MESLNEVDDFLERQGDIVRVLAAAKHAEEVHKAAMRDGRPLSSLLMKSLDAKLLRNQANEMVEDYEAKHEQTNTR
jgi:hypothetical protein